MTLRPPQPACLLVIAALTAIASAGCICNGLPRIDPSGERFFVCPLSQATVPPVAASGATIPPPAGNTVAAPVLPAAAAPTGPRCPLCPLCPFGDGCPLCPLGDGCPLCPFGDRQPAPVIGPVAPVVGGVAAQPTNRVTLTPGRVLAPVGSEVVMRAGVCGKDGYLLTNRKIEWMIDQEGVGQFAEIGDAGQRDFMRYPWSTPRKVNNTYAVGYTSPVHTCLRRGTDDPADDVQINDGEAWVSITSPSEGTSYITAYAPNEENWNARRAQATIYWVDAQWQLPPSAVVAAGQPHILSTTITRQTDGAPLQGWIVRYEVADGSAARLGYDAGQVAEVATDGRGVAQVEVAPTDSQPGTSRVRITVVRPEQAGIASSPRLDVGAGEATVTWSNTAPGTQPLFPPVAPPAEPPTLPPTTAPPSTPPPAAGPPSNEPPIGINPPGRPELEIRIRRDTPDPIKVGDKVAYTLTVRNIGNGVAQNVRLRDKFDSGLTTELDRDGLGAIKNDAVGDLAPRDSVDLTVVFDVLTAGPHSHEVTVTADGVAEAFDKAEFTAIEEQPAAAQVGIRIFQLSPVRPPVGKESFRFSIEIENSSDVPARNLRLRIAPDPALTVSGILPRPLDESTTPLSDGGASTELGELGPRQKRVVHYGFDCNMATQVGSPAEVRVFLTGDGINVADATKVEILPPAAAGPAAAPLRITVGSQANPVRLRASSDLVVTLENTTGQPLTNVAIEITDPAQLSFRPRVATLPQGTALLPQPSLLQLSPPIGRLLPGAAGRQQIVIPYDAITPGQAVIDVKAVWQGAPAAVTERVIISVEP